VSFPTSAEAQLVSALRDAGNLIVSHVAASAGEIVGHVAFSEAVVQTGERCVGLAPVAVVPAYRRRGIADRLIRSGISACADTDYAFIVVLGEPAYYRRFGFLPASSFTLVDEYGGGDAFQVLELVRGGIPGSGGLVRYAPQFAAL
jgi:putative acetyltransferase